MPSHPAKKFPILLLETINRIRHAIGFINPAFVFEVPFHFLCDFHFIIILQSGPIAKNFCCLPLEWGLTTINSDEGLQGIRSSIDAVDPPLCWISQPRIIHPPLSWVR